MKGIRTFAMRLTLLVTLVAGTAILLVSAAHMAMAVWSVRTHALESVRAQARVIAANSTAALDFDDAEAARDTLRGLSTVPQFAAAEIVKVGPDGRVEPFAEYRLSEGHRLPDRALGPGSSLDGRWLTFVQPIVRDGERIGELRVLYDFGPLRWRLALELGLGVLLALAAVALSFAAARRVQRSMLRPVRELVVAAETIAHTDDYSVRAKKVSRDELGALTDVFNSMVERIGEAEAMRRNHRALLEAEVSRRTAEVVEAQSRLRQSERMAALGTLSAGLGHDIGNLLLPLRSHIAAIRERFGPGAEPEEDFAAIARATEYLQNLSTSLRMFAQDSEGLEGRREPTQLGPWWAQTEPLLRSTVGKRIALEHDIPADVPAVGLAQSLLTQAVFNLVQNAAQAMTREGHAARGSRIAVSARVLGEGEGPERVAISVADNGPGMTEEVRSRCVEPYFTTKTRQISSGLGLSLVKGIVERVGGGLEVESEVGVGSTFTVVLPAAPAAASPRRTRAIVAMRDERRRAVVTHLLRSLHCDVRAGPAREEDAETAASEGDILVADSIGSVPPGWRGRVVLIGGNGGAADADRPITLVDAAAPLPALRSAFREILSGAS